MNDNTNIPTTINLAEIAKSFVEMDKVYNLIVKTASKTVIKIAESEISRKDVKKFLQISTITDNYLSAIVETIRSLTSANLRGDVQGLYDLLGYIVEVEEKKNLNGEIIKTNNSKYVLIDGILAMGQIYSSINRLLGEVGKSDYGKNFIKTRMNIALFKKNVNSVLKLMVDSFKSLDIDANTIESLLGDEENTKELINRYHRGSDIGKDTNKTISILSSSVERNRTTRKHGVLDVFTSYLNVVTGISNLVPPSLVKTKINIIRTNIVLKSVLSSMVKLAQDFGTPDNVVSFENLAQIYDLINNSFKSLSRVVEDLTGLSKQLNIVRRIAIKHSIDFLYHKEGGSTTGVFIDLVNLLKDESVKELATTSEGDKSVITQLSKSVKQFSDLVLILARFGSVKVLSQLIISSQSIDFVAKTLKKLNTLNKTISEIVLDDKKINTLNASIKNLLVVVGNLTAIFAVIIPLGLLAGVALLGPIQLLTLGVKALNSFVAAINIDEERLRSALSSMTGLLAIVGNLTAIFAVIIPLGLLAGVALLGPIWLLVLGIKALGVVIRVLNSIPSPTRALSKIVVISLLLLNLALMCAVLVSISTIAAKIDIVVLAVFFAELLGVIAATLLIGGLLVLASPILLPASLAIVAFTVVVTLLSVLAVTLLLVQNINLDAEKIHNNVNTVIDTALDIVTSIFSRRGLSDEIQQSSEENWIKTLITHTMGGLSTIIETIMSISILANTFVSVAIVLMIATVLRVLQEINLDRQSILNNVESVILTSKYISGTITDYKVKSIEQQQVSDNEISIVNSLAPIGGGILEFAKMLLTAANLSTTVVSVALLWGVTTMLNKIAEFDLDEERIVSTVNRVIRCANTVSRAVMSGGSEQRTTTQEGLKGLISGVGHFIKNNVKAVGSVIDNISSASVLSTALIAATQLNEITTILDKISKFSIDEDRITDTTNQIIRIANQISIQVGSTSSGVSTIDDKKVKSFGVYVDDSVKLMKQINKLDTNKLIKYSDMWTKMSEFMDKMKEINIEELSDAIVNKIAPAMGNISDNVDKMGNRDTSVNIATNPAATVPVTQQPTDKTIKLPPEKPIDYTELLTSIKTLLEEYLEA